VCCVCACGAMPGRRLAPQQPPSAPAKHRAPAQPPSGGVPAEGSQWRGPSGGVPAEGSQRGAPRVDTLTPRAATSRHQPVDASVHAQAGGDGTSPSTRVCMHKRGGTARGAAGCAASRRQRLNHRPRRPRSAGRSHQSRAARGARGRLAAPRASADSRWSAPTTRRWLSRPSRPPGSRCAAACGF